MSSNLFPVSIESERLRYEPLHESVDALDLYEYHRSGELDAVLRLLRERPHATPKETVEALAESRDAWESSDRATYAIHKKDGGEFVGVSELWLEWEKRKVSFGVWIREPFWGRGYSDERAGAMLYVAFDRLDLDLVSIEHEPENDQSKRSIGKYVETYGGQFDGVLRNGLPAGDFGGPRDLHLYSISKSQWRENVSADETSGYLVTDGR
ncbi:Protein N-acetyltransferase, RimJ/RimL family [Haladaptatus litoreus]|uniref:Protein N-acetyltransferase, RimJ/RimL family n=1 Tax=Haladaptatus litoreus TaxID=553468 RepID=A0A1N7D0U4_9EURY|nr:GNAT family protein [Haladaptatus litoreus]SIR69325.1 Protein N-acetyltransferase, RimJ/RimL family [Haladaptatus litoreus]